MIISKREIEDTIHHSVNMNGLEINFALDPEDLFVERYDEKKGGLVVSIGGDCSEGGEWELHFHTTDRFNRFMHRVLKGNIKLDEDKTDDILQMLIKHFDRNRFYSTICDWNKPCAVFELY